MMTEDIRTERERLPTAEELMLVPIDPLKYLYTVMKERLITEEEALTYDWTRIFWYNFKDKIEHGELIRVLIRGEVRTGKSTTGHKIKYEINQHLYKIKKQHKRVDEVQNTLMDQTEFVRFAMQEQERHQCVQIDEYNTMAEGGANSTTEQQLLQTYSDMFASRYIHVINCNPTQMRDSNAFIHLETIGKIDGYTRCKLIYCNNIEGDMLTLGYVDIYVGDIIEKWEKDIRPIFEKQNRTKEDEENIKKAAETDWYTRYQIKKEKRQELIQKHHVRDIRELEFSDVVLKTHRELEEVSELEKLGSEVILAVLQDVCRREGRIYSMYAELNVMSKVKSLLTLKQMLTKYEKKALKLHLQVQKSIIQQKTTNKIILPDEEQKLIQAAHKFKQLYEKRVKEEERMSELFKEYVQIQG